MSLTMSNVSIFDFEEEFPVQESHQWVADHWHATLIIGIFYFFAIHSGEVYMKNRQPYSLRPMLIFWNIALTLFSFMGATRMVPKLITVLHNGGLRATVCDNEFMLGPDVSSLWAWLFTVSKVIELGDTAFIVLRKQPLHFLHWFHHIVTMIGVTYCYATGHAMGLWSSSMNFTIHTIMYGYYALRAMKIPIPKIISMGITVLQIVQMFFGFTFSLWALLIHLRGESCNANVKNSLFCIISYFFYMVLFVNFFQKSYFRKAKQVKLS